jgi:hypothetical protein
VSVHVGDAQSSPLPERGFDAVVSGLALSFVPDPSRAVAEFVRVADARGIVAAYVGDYAEGMAMMRYFWDAATALDPARSGLDEGNRFPLCRPDSLRREWLDTGASAVVVRPVEVPSVFADFDDYFGPFLGVRDRRQGTSRRSPKNTAAPCTTCCAIA